MKKRTGNYWKRRQLSEQKLFFFLWLKWTKKKKRTSLLIYLCYLLWGPLISSCGRQFLLSLFCGWRSWYEFYNAASSFWFYFDGISFNAFCFWRMMPVAVTVIIVMDSFKLPSCKSIYLFNAIKRNNFTKNFATLCTFCGFFFHFHYYYTYYWNISTFQQKSHCSIFVGEVLFCSSFFFGHYLVPVIPLQWRQRQQRRNVWNSCIMILVGEMLNKV